MKILLTAFEPFNGSSVNPSQLILEKVTTLEDKILIKELLPVEFEKTSIRLKQLLQEYEPDIVLSLGQAGNRSEICVERVAINLNNVRSSDGKKVLADNAGETPVDKIIKTDGATAYFSNLPVWDMVQAIQSVGVKGAVSYSAGTYVCNHVMYTVLYEVTKYYPNMKAGFVHVPFLLEQWKEKQKNGNVQGYAMELEDMVRGIEAVLKIF
ncbi:MAG: pyroglutamyl-peptidase I [Lachnospiraceae bacterium]|nr:pyroglutamyl-peptidase I [Lachnospiraceae bacterium]